MGGGESKETHFTWIKKGDEAVEKAEIQRSVADRERLFAEAFDHYQSALDVNPNYHLTYMRRGLAMQKIGNHQEAILDFEDCLALNPLFYAANFAKADSLDEMDEFELAVMERSRVPKAVRQRRQENVEVYKAEQNRQVQHSTAVKRAHTYSAFNGSGKAKDSDQQGTRSATTSGAYETNGETEDDERGEEMLTEKEQEHQRRVVEFAKAGIVLGDKPFMTDDEKYAPLKKKWEAEDQRARNVKRFMTGQRGIYVKSAAQKRSIDERSDRKCALGRYAMEQDHGGSRKGGYGHIV